MSTIDKIRKNIYVKNCFLQADLEGFDTGRLRDSPSGGLFKFGQRTPTKYGDASTSHAARCLFGGPPLSEGSQRLLKSPRKPQRKVPKNPYKVNKGLIYLCLGKLYPENHVTLKP